MTFHPRAILHCVSWCVILCHAVILQVHERRSEVRMGSITPQREGRAQCSDLLLGGNELGVSILPSRGGFIVFRGSVGRQEERNPSSHITNGHFPRLCMYVGFNKGRKGHSFLLQAAWLFLFWRLKEELGWFNWFRVEAFKATLVSTLGEGRHSGSGAGRQLIVQGYPTFTDAEGEKGTR